MAEIALLFRAERWLTAWRAIGGTSCLSAPLNLGDMTADGLMELGPTFRLAETDDSPRRREYQRLRTQIEQPGARVAVIAYLERRGATEGRA